MARPHLEADNMFAVFGVTFDDTIEIDILDVAQFRHAVTGDETDGTEIEEGLDALSRGLNDIFTETVEIRLTRRTGIHQRGHAALGPAFRGADGDIGAAMPDMHMQIHPAGRDEGTLGINTLRINGRLNGRPNRGDLAIAADQNIGRSLWRTLFETDGFDIGEKNGSLKRRCRLFTGRHITNPFAVLGRACPAARHRPFAATARKE